MGHDASIAVITSSCVKGLGFLKEVVVAWMFGVSGAIDIYVMALALIAFPASLFLNAISNAFVVRLAGASGQERLYFPVAVLTLACLTVLLPIWLLLVPYAVPWLAAGFSVDKRE